MSKKKLYNMGGIVYSTASDFNLPNEEETAESISPGKQLLTIVIDKKQRGGKVVSLVKGFIMKEKEMETLAKQLKAFCGTGGGSKDNEIIIQGDQREKIFQWLLKNGYTKTRKI